MGVAVVYKTRQKKIHTFEFILVSLCSVSSRTSRDLRYCNVEDAYLELKPAIPAQTYINLFTIINYFTQRQISYLVKT